MKSVLTVNAGSTSLKLERYELRAPLAAIAAPPAPAAARSVEPGVTSEALADWVREPVAVVAHRVVRMPSQAPAILRLDAAVQERIAAAGADAPLHDARALRVVGLIAQLRPELPQFAVSDSAFHRTLGAAASTYALPRALTQAGFHRRGYHGLSHEYAAHRGCALAGLDIERSRVVTAHLGGGSSLCAIRNGRSIDTTMGYTPLEGLPMATRSGSVDPGLLVHLLRDGMTVDALDEMLERQSGLLGISGFSGDVRELEAAHGDPDAKLALDVLAWRIRTSLGAMIAALGGVDLLTFTGGIGEHAPGIRAAALEGGLGAAALLDPARNAASLEGRIDAAESGPAICVITAREGWQLARAVAGE